MKLKRNSLLMALAVAGILLSNYQTSQSKIAQPPAGNDGGPNGFPPGQTCAQCHSGGGLRDGAGLAEITFDDGSTTAAIDSFKYVPGTQYAVTFHPTFTATRYGFQMSVLNSSNQSTGTWAVTNSTNTVIATGAASTKYISHKDANSNNTWTFNWTAPATDIGEITFYYAFVGANGNTQENGDTVYHAFRDVAADAGTGIAKQPVANLSVYPNPATNNIQVRFHTEMDKATMNLYSFDGKLVKEFTAETGTGLINKTLNLEDVNAGIYLLQVKAGEKQSTLKIAVQ